VAVATVLAVDDEQQICKNARVCPRGRRLLGSEPLTAPRRPSIAHARPGGLGLLLSDLDMPGISGASLAQELRIDAPDCL
jgi:FixJ family two-component response regulator